MNYGFNSLLSLFQSFKYKIERDRNFYVQDEVAKLLETRAGLMEILRHVVIISGNDQNAIIYF